MRIQPTLLMILDGWGYREESEYNAIAQANTPQWDKWWQTYSHCLLSASGTEVGLPDKQMGNSEVGHMNLGAGRTIFQDYTRINNSIANGELQQNSVLIELFQGIKKRNGCLHLMGMLSAGGVHSHEEHLFALLKAAKASALPEVLVHAFLDGRDTPPQSAFPSMQQLEKLCAQLGQSRVASVIGRYFAMDRDHRWERTAQAFALINSGQGLFEANSGLEAINLAYDRKENDEFVQATCVLDKHSQPTVVTENDAILFFNFRSDRARQLTAAFTQENFSHFERTRPIHAEHFVTMSQFSKEFHCRTLYPPQQHRAVLGEVLSQNQLKQLRTAETEKYAHVTFFFNGGIEEAFPGEERRLIASADVATYDLQPAMSAKQLTDVLVTAIENCQHHVIICNFANPDMVGHTGNFAATVEAIEYLDHCFVRLEQALQKVDGQALVTADHGNAELMFDKKTEQPHTAHTNLTVPLIYLGKKATLDRGPGILADVAPTLLSLLQIEPPAAMTGRSLVTLR